MITNFRLAVIISLFMSIIIAILNFHNDYVAEATFIVLWGICMYNIYKTKS